MATEEGRMFAKLKHDARSGNMEGISEGMTRLLGHGFSKHFLLAFVAAAMGFTVVYTGW